MIPHHINAVNMAKLLLKQTPQEELDAVEDLEEILYNIINTQNFQIHQFRNYLNPDGQLLDAGVTNVVPPLIEGSDEGDEAEMEEMGEEGEADCQSIPDIICSDNDYSYLCGVMTVILGSFDETTSDGDYTLFAPSNKAFQAIEDALGDLDEETVASVLMFHLTEGKVCSSDLVCKGQVAMMDGTKSRTQCTDNIDGNDAIVQKGGGNFRNSLLPRIVKADIEACSGYIHGVDNVMLPDYIPTFMFLDQELEVEVSGKTADDP